MNRLFHSRLFWPAFTLLALILVNGWLTPGFFEIALRNGRYYGSLIDIALRSAPLILVSLGMTAVIATRGVDLSVGAVAALAPAVAAFALQQSWGPVAAIAASLSVAGIAGLWNGTLIAALGLQPIVATLIAMVAGRGIAQLLLDGEIVSIGGSTLTFIGRGDLFGLPFAIAVWIGAFALFCALFRASAAGLFTEALGSNPYASRFAGLETRFINIGVYAVCALAAGIAGLIASANIGAVDVNNLGLYLELDAILAVVIGGTRLTGGRFTLMGSVLGALIIQTVSTTINTQGVPIEIMLMVKASIVIAVCLLQADGLRDWGYVFRRRADRQIDETSIIAIREAK